MYLLYKSSIYIFEYFFSFMICFHHLIALKESCCLLYKYNINIYNLFIIWFHKLLAMKKYLFILQIYYTYFYL